MFFNLIKKPSGINQRVFLFAMILLFLFSYFFYNFFSHFLFCNWLFLCYSFLFNDHCNPPLLLRDLIVTLYFYSNILMFIFKKENHFFLLKKIIIYKNIFKGIKIATRKISDKKQLIFEFVT